MIGIGRVAVSLIIGLQVGSKPIEPPQGPMAESFFYYLLGSLASLDKNPKIALEHFRFAASLDPRSSTILLREAHELFELGDVNGAKDLVERAEADHQDNSDLHLLKSKIASQELNAEEATKSLDKAIQIFRETNNDYKHRETVLTKVALLADFKKYDECVKTLKDYLKIDPNDEVAYYFLGKVHSVFQNRDESRKAFQKALQLRPNFSVATRALGLQLELEGKMTEALDIYRKAIESGGGDEDLLQKAINLSLASEDYEGALKYLNQFLTIAPEDAQNQLRAGLIHFKLGHLEEAKAAFTKLLTSTDVAQDRVRFYLASVYDESRQHKEAVDHFLQVQVQSEYYVESRIQAAQLASKELKDGALGLRALEEANTKKSGNPDLIMALANQYEFVGRSEAGLALLKKSSEKFSDHEKIQFLYGVFQDKNGAREASIETMRKVLKINPNNPHALNHIGYLFAEQNMNLAEAEVLLKKAVQLAPDNGFIVDSLGWVYFRLGKYQKSIEYLEKANRLSPGQAVILEHMADAYTRLGRNKEALAVYRQIMGWSAGAESTELDPETKAVQERVRVKIAEFSAARDAD